MKKFFSEEYVEILKDKGLTENEISDLNETIHLYYKKYSSIELGKIRKKITSIDNLKDLMRYKEAFGVKYPKVLEKIVLNEIDNNFKKEYIYKGLTYRTLRSSAPDYADMGGTSYYRVFFTESELILYCLDNFYRLVEIKNFKIENILGVSLFNKIHVEGKDVSIYYIVIDILDSGKNYKYYMYSTEKTEVSTLPKFNEILLSKGIKKIQRKSIEEKKLSSKIGVGIGILIILILIIGIISAWF